MEISMALNNKVVCNKEINFFKFLKKNKKIIIKSIVVIGGILLITFVLNKTAYAYTKDFKEEYSSLKEVLSDTHFYDGLIDIKSNGFPIRIRSIEEVRKKFPEDVLQLLYDISHPIETTKVVTGDFNEMLHKINEDIYNVVKYLAK